ncbi:MAG: hypothetical protein ACU826_10275 [Gammaproteobacteria bacterium]
MGGFYRRAMGIAAIRHFFTASGKEKMKATGTVEKNGGYHEFIIGNFTHLGIAFFVNSIDARGFVPDRLSGMVQHATHRSRLRRKSQGGPWLWSPVRKDALSVLL